jgi:hypothetical protein
VLGTVGSLYRVTIRLKRSGSGGDRCAARDSVAATLLVTCSQVMSDGRRKRA